MSHINQNKTFLPWRGVIGDLSTFGDITQMARVLDLHSRSREFESHYLHKMFFDNMGPNGIDWQIKLLRCSRREFTYLLNLWWKF